jgi:adenylate cyclase
MIVPSDAVAVHPSCISLSFPTGAKERFMSPLVREVMIGVAKILDAERCTLFLSDPRKGKLWAIVAQGIENIQIEIPDNKGIAGAVFTNGAMLNIPDAYQDPRFNQVNS